MGVYDANASNLAMVTASAPTTVMATAASAEVAASTTTEVIAAPAEVTASSTAV